MIRPIPPTRRAGPISNAIRLGINIGKTPYKHKRGEYTTPTENGMWFLCNGTNPIPMPKRQSMGKYLFRYIVILPIKGKKGYVKN
jgi:hypothetical protein